MAVLRMTIPTLRVLEVMTSANSDQLYGLEIGRRAGLRSGTVHPILARLERAGWAESAWESIDPSAEGRPARRYYWLTGDGASRARRALAKSRQMRPSGAPVTQGRW